MKVRDTLEIKLHLETPYLKTEFTFCPFYALHTEIQFNLISLEEAACESSVLL